MNPIRKVLWTGGWDSTFRIIELFRNGAIIQPIYAYDTKRVSSSKELETIESITLEVKSLFPKSSGEILPLEIIYKRDIPNSIFLKLAFKILRKKTKAGRQYYWLACLATKIKDLELSIEMDTNEKLFSNSILIPVNSDNKQEINWKIDTKKANIWTKLIFQNMRFPLLLTSKLEMKSIAEENGYISIMNKTWFCHKSTEKPCGKCNPCKSVINSTLPHRFHS